MNYPLLILNDASAAGTHVSIYRYQGEIHRIFSVNVLLFVLRNTLLCTYKGEKTLLSESGILYVAEEEEVCFSTEEAFVLQVSIPDMAIGGNGCMISLKNDGSSDDRTSYLLKDVIRRLMDNQLGGGRFYKLLEESLWKEFYYLLLSRCYTDQERTLPVLFPGETAPDSARQSSFADILRTIEENYSSHIQLKDLADTYFYTPSYLSRLFVRYTGMNYNEYLSELRLKKAMPMLLQTTMEIGVISDKVGFPNPRAFQQAFQKKYGIRPTRYRANYKDVRHELADENLRENLRTAYKSGLLSVFLEDHSNVSAENNVEELLDYGTFVYGEGTPCALSRRNSILNVDRMRDLLLDHVQDMVRRTQKDMGYEYLTCHGFLADDMQVVTTEYLREDLSEGPSRRYRFDFSMYDTVLRFVQGTGMKMIIQLGYTPSVLAPEGEKADPIHRSCICMPADMETWNQYIEDLFLHLYHEFGDWLLSCSVQLWQVPDVHIQLRKKVNEADFFLLYQNTYRTVRKVLPGIRFGSPTITVTQGGLNFERSFLRYCRDHDCVPDYLNYTHYYRSVGTFRFKEAFVEARGFVEETRNTLRSLGLNAKLPMNLMEYTYGFGRSAICDSSVGAMFPLSLTIPNMNYFDRFGYWGMTDYTTGFAKGRSQFEGGHGLLTVAGGEKAVYYAIRFMASLGQMSLGFRKGLAVFRKNNTVQLLLYYDIPASDWTDEYYMDHELSFYKMYLDRRVRIGIEDLPWQKVLVRESRINYLNGSAYETWYTNGGALMDTSEIHKYSSRPAASAYVQENTEGRFLYSCTMKPFELRLVELSAAPVQNENN